MVNRRSMRVALCTAKRRDEMVRYLKHENYFHQIFGNLVKPKLTP